MRSFYADYGCNTVTGVTLRKEVTRYNAHMIFSHIFKGFLAGLLTVALLAIAPTGLTPPAHAEMNHGALDQGCLSGCMNNSPSQPPALSNQRPEGEQNEAPKYRLGPYYLQFNYFYAPRELTSQTNEPAYVLRPPDLVKLYATYRN